MLRLIVSQRKFFLRLCAEMAGLLLMVGFVIALATLPPISLKPNPGSPIHYALHVETSAWKLNIDQYVGMVRHGTLGADRRGTPVGELVSARLYNSLLLLGTAGALALVLGVVKGFLDFQALRRRRVSPGPIVTSAVAGLPDFWLVLMLQVGASWLWRTFDFNAFKVTYDDGAPLGSMVYPIIALSLIPLAQIARITATAMGDVYGKEYVRTARAKGLTELVVVYKHALRNALVQILDSLPSVMAVTLSNLLVVEYLFTYPGLTTLLKEAVAPSTGGRAGVPVMDTPVLVVAGVSLGLIFSCFYLLVRLLRRIADPRLKGSDLS